MKINMPVTNNEVMLGDHHTIVSKTDLKGQITYVNRDFLEISGFDESELVGTSHNIVRHPDMPPEAFEDLWRNLKAGRPWNGLVKNRCKNGDYYWVEANAAPLWESGKIVGYVSVRTKPARQQVEAAAALYRQFREGKADGREILNGKVLKRQGPIGRLRRQLTVKLRLTVLVVAALLGLALTGGIGVFGTANGIDGVERLHRDYLTQAGRYGDVDEYLMSSMIDLQLATAHNPMLPSSKEHDHPVQKHLEAIEDNLQAMEKTLAELDANAADPQLKRRIGEYAAAAVQMRDIGFKPAIEMLRNGQYDAASAHIVRKLLPIYESGESLADALREGTFEEANAAVVELRSEAGKSETTELVLAGSVVVLLVLLGIGTVRAVCGPLDFTLRTVRHLAAGEFRNEIPIDSYDEVGEMLAGLKSMQTQLGFEVLDQQVRGAETMRIKIGLDNVATNVMIADSEHRIIYLNHAIKRMFEDAEDDLRKELPDFSAAGLMGSCMDLFHKDPARQRRLIDGLQGNHRGTVKVGGHTFNLSVTPVVDGSGKRLGTAVEWVDRSAEVAIEEEVAGVVEAAAAGDFGRRIPVDGKDGFFLQVSTGLNDLMDTTAQGLSDIARLLDAIARGDLTQSISRDYQGTFGQLKDDTNTTVARLREVLGRIVEATGAINTAAQEISAGNADLSSRTEEQASSLEETASSMEELNATVRQNAENARQANDLAHASNTVAERGGQMMGRVVSTMSSIQESSRKIADIIGVIDSIAFQTNILALNAAVEAARAGEQGRGFAVVASEVRSLAQRSAQAAKEIKGLIDDSVGKVEQGANLVDDAGKTMGEVVENFQRLAALVTEIAEASKEQSSGIEQVTRAVGQMDEVTQQNAALVEQAAAAAESLEEQARGLQGAVSMFRMESATGSAVTATSNVTSLPLRGGRSAAGKASAPLKPGGARKAPAADDEWEAF